MKKTIVLIKKLKEAAVLVRISLSEAKALVKVHSKNITRSLNSSQKNANI